MRYSFLLFTIALLTACAGGDWPGQYGEDPTAYDYPIVEKRWTTASRTSLGSPQDIAEITATLKRAHPDMVIREIRWLSATETMAITVRGAGLVVGEEFFYAALKKDGDTWSLAAWYDGSAS